MLRVVLLGRLVKKKMARTVLTDEEKRAKNAAKMRKWRAANPEKARKSSRIYSRNRRWANIEKSRERERQYYGVNRDRIRAQNKLSYAASPQRQEKAKARHKEWQEANWDKTLQRNREWKAANPSKRYNQNKKHRLANPETYREYARTRIARKKNQEGWIPENCEYLLWVFQEGLCAYCTEVLIEYEVDHKLPLSRGGPHDWSNICLACPSCNRKKSKKTPDEFISLMNAA